MLQCLREADTIQRLLLHSIDHVRKANSRNLQQGARHIVDMCELRAQSPSILDARRPGNYQRITHAAKMRGDRLPPLKGVLPIHPQPAAYTLRGTR